MEQLKTGSKDPLMMSGPKFGESDGWWSGFKKWLGRNSQRITILIIGVLIIAGGIYLFSNRQQPASIIGPGEEVSQEEQNQEGVVTPEQIKVEQKSPTQAQPTVPATQSANKAEYVKTEGNNIVVKANKGAGVTHLARQALKDYLNQHQDLKQSVTPEHKIYIEDYLSKKTGQVKITVGKELNFDQGLIKEAIDKSQKLTDKQLNNLHKYVLLVPSLST